MMTPRRNTVVLQVVLAAFAAGAFAGSPTSVLEAVAAKDKAALRTLLRNGADVNAAMADGSVRFIKDTVDPVIFRALVTRAGGVEEVGVDGP